MTTVTDREPDYKTLVEPFHAEECTPQGRLEAAFRHCYWDARDKFPSDQRKAEALRVANEFVSAGVALLRNGDYLSIPKLIGTFAQRMREVGQPLPVPTPDTEITRVAPVLVSESGCNWASIEVDFLRQWLRMGERLVRYDKWGAETDTRRAVTRFELRRFFRPISHKNDFSWESQWEGHDIPAREGI